MKESRKKRCNEGKKKGMEEGRKRKIKLEKRKYKN